MLLCRLANTRRSEAYNAARSQVQRSDDVYKTPPIKSRGDTFALSKCPAYVPVHTAGIRDHQEVGEPEYEVVLPTSNV